MMTTMLPLPAAGGAGSAVTLSPPTGALPAVYFAVQVYQLFVLMTAKMVIKMYIIGFDVYINVTQKSVLS